MRVDDFERNMQSEGSSMSKRMVVSGEQQHRLKAEIAAHPLYEQLLSAHVSCLHVATPIDQLPLIDGDAHHLLRSYYAHTSTHSLSKSQDQEQLDTFLGEYILLLSSFREKLHHVGVEAATRCHEIHHKFHSLTGATVGEGSGATMSDNEEDDDEDDDDEQQQHQIQRDSTDYECGLDLINGSLDPFFTQTDRSLMERVRKELKIEFKQELKSRINQVREKIHRKRRAGKLADDATTILNNWWHRHYNWPYPTEDEKAKLVEETGIELKQVNNWFINQRKRKWQNSHSLSAPRIKHKRS